jgi:DNA polymerase-4
MARCIFPIDLDAFFVSMEQAFNPKLKGMPVIMGGDPER